MSRNRAYVLVAVLVVFIVTGGILIYAARSQGGQNVTINLKVTGAGKMTPDHPSAHLNDRVTMSVTSDAEGEVHLHGYDIRFEVKAGQTVTHTFTADKTGTFDIEWEKTGTPLGDFTVS